MSAMNSVPKDFGLLLRSALLGADRTKAEDASLAGWKFEAAAEDNAHTLLRNAALLAQLHCAGQAQKTRTTTISSPESPLDESRPRVNAQAELRLQTLLQEAGMTLISEWLSTAASVQKRVPPRVLPQLFEMFRTRNNGHATKELCTTIGTRGFWLAAQNPDWSFILDAASEGIFPDAPQPIALGDAEIAAMWNTGKLRERVSLLRSLRRTVSPRASELVGSTWPSEDLKARRELLQAFAVGLKAQDEAFIEEVRKSDRSDEVRQIASDLLLRLPDSSFTHAELQRRRRLERRAQTIIKVHKPLLGEIKVQIEPPEKFELSMSEDGIIEKAKAGAQGGPRAWWLEQIVSSIDPSFWSTLSASLSPEKFLKAILKSDWVAAMLAGLRNSTLLYRNPEWAETLLATSADRELLNVLPKSQRLSIQTALFLKAWEQLPDGVGAVFPLLTEDGIEWSVELGRLALQKIRKLAATKMEGAATYQLQYQLGKFAMKIPASLASEAQVGWPEDSPEWPKWKGFVEPMLDILQKRADMIREIQAP